MNGSTVKGNEPEASLPADDEAPVDEEMVDVDANNSVSSEHPGHGAGLWHSLSLALAN